jgi:hypothetical protein
VLLLQWTAAAPPTSISSSREFLELIDRYADGWRFFFDDPTVQLDRLGVTDSDFTVAESWDQSLVVGALLSIWEATGRYVDTYVDHAYPADHDVQAYHQLAKWIAASSAPGRRQHRRPARDGLQRRTQAGSAQPDLSHDRARNQPPLSQRESGPDLRPRELDARLAHLITLLGGDVPPQL